MAMVYQGTAGSGESYRMGLSQHTECGIRR